MPNVLNRLVKDKRLELMPDELTRLLDAELAKPEDEMDTQLVSELLHLVEKDAPTDADMAADWQAISQKLNRRRLPVVLRRAAIAAASIIAAFLVTYTSARAFNWTLLLKYLMPVAQTFGIVTPDYEVEQEQNTRYWAADNDTSREMEFSSLDDIPGEIGKAIAASGCLPEGYAFVQGTWSDDGVLQKWSLYMTKGDQWATLEALEVAQDAGASFDVEYERQAEVPGTIEIDGVDVTVYYNSDEDGLSVSWLSKGVHYNLYGMLTEDELRHVIHALNT